MFGSIMPCVYPHACSSVMAGRSLCTLSRNASSQRFCHLVSCMQSSRRSQRTAYSKWLIMLASVQAISSLETNGPSSTAPHLLHNDLLHLCSLNLHATSFSLVRAVLVFSIPV